MENYGQIQKQSKKKVEFLTIKDKNLIDSDEITCSNEQKLNIIDSEKTNRNKNIKSVNSYNSCSINSGKRLIFISYILMSLIIVTILNKEIVLGANVIKLKINKSGNIKILGQVEKCNDTYPSPYPDKIYINDIEQTIIENKDIFSSSQTTNEIKLVWNSDITSTGCMFFDCSDINEIDFTGFDTSHVTYFAHMFSGCSSIASLDLSNFKTEIGKDISYMFRGCSSLKSLDLTKFVTSNVKYMHYMFGGCSSLTSLKINNLDTSHVKDMNNMFRDCSSLSSIDLSSFNTINVENIAYIFYNCHSLTSLNVSNFDTRNVFLMNYTFYNCTLLSSLDVSNFNTST